MGTNLKDKNGNNIYPIIKNTDIQTSEGVAFNPQEKLPNASASGKVLTSTNTTGGFEWADPTGGGGTSNFNSLTNRPSYNSVVMTNETNIPEVKTATWDAKSVVSGTNDGTNWQTITINGTTKAIPVGGGGSASVELPSWAYDSESSPDVGWTTAPIYSETNQCYYAIRYTRFKESNNYFEAVKSTDLLNWNVLNDDFTFPNVTTYSNQVQSYATDGNTIVFIVGYDSGSSSNKIFKGTLNDITFSDPSNNMTELTIDFPSGVTMNYVYNIAYYDNKFIIPTGVYQGKKYLLYSTDLSTFTTIELPTSDLNNSKYFNPSNIIKISDHYFLTDGTTNCSSGFFATTGNSLDTWEWITLSSGSYAYFKGRFSNVYDNSVYWVSPYGSCDVYKLSYNNGWNVITYRAYNSSCNAPSKSTQMYILDNYLYYFSEKAYRSEKYQNFGALCRLRLDQIFICESGNYYFDNNNHIEYLCRFNRISVNTGDYVRFCPITNYNHCVFVYSIYADSDYVEFNNALINSKNIDSLISNVNNTFIDSYYDSSLKTLYLGKFDTYHTGSTNKDVETITVNQDNYAYKLVDSKATKLTQKHVLYDDFGSGYSRSTNTHFGYVYYSSFDYNYNYNEVVSFGDSLYTLNNSTSTQQVIRSDGGDFTSNSYNFSNIISLPCTNTPYAYNSMRSFIFKIINNQLYLLLLYSSGSTTSTMYLELFRMNSDYSWASIGVSASLINVGSYKRGCELKYANNKFFAIIENTGCYVLNSSNNFEELTSLKTYFTTPTNSSNIFQIQYLNSNYIFVFTGSGANFITQLTYIVYSSDLNAFNVATHPNPSSSSQYPTCYMPIMKYANSKYYIYGFKGTQKSNYQHCFMETSDFQTWTCVDIGSGTLLGAFPKRHLYDEENETLYVINSSTPYKYAVIDFKKLKLTINNGTIQSIVDNTNFFYIQNSNCVDYGPYLTIFKNNSIGFIQNRYIHFEQINHDGAIGDANGDRTDAFREVLDINIPKTVGAAVSSSNKFIFNVGTDVNGMYIFSFGNTMTNLFMYNLVNGTTYKTTGTFVYDSMGSVVTTTLNYKLNGTNLEIWSGNSNFTIVNGFTGYLFKVKLY